MTIKEALKYANKKIAPKVDDVLSKEVYQFVRQLERNIIDEQVYEVYDPNPDGYTRRASGGLSDEKNIVMEGGKAQNGRLIVKNVTPPNPGGVPNDSLSRVTVDKNLSEVIEYGQRATGGYDFADKGGEFLKPRPFTEKTVETIERTNLHVEFLKDGLKRRGLKIK